MLLAGTSSESGPKHVNETQIVRHPLLVQRQELGGHKTFGKVRGVVELLAALGEGFELRKPLDAAGVTALVGKLKAEFDATRAELRRKADELQQDAEEKLRLQLEACKQHEEQLDHQMQELRRQTEVLASRDKDIADLRQQLAERNTSIPAAKPPAPVLPTASQHVAPTMGPEAYGCSTQSGSGCRAARPIVNATVARSCVDGAQWGRPACAQDA